MPNLPHNPTPEELHKAYEDGFEGWLWNKEIEAKWEKFWEERPTLYTMNPELKDIHKEVGKAYLWQYRHKVDPRAFDEERQTTGDCTSHGSRNARDFTRAVESFRGNSKLYGKRSATEPTYGARGWTGEGMDPTDAARFETEVGFLFRELYNDPSTGLNLDLRKYNANIGINWGRSGVPENVKALCRKHKVGSSVRPTDSGEVADCLARGSAGHSGQSWGTSSKQPKDGINRKSASWGHDMATGGFDFTKEIWKEEVFFVFNSWEDWNEPNPVWLAHQDVLGPWITGCIVIAREEYERYFVKSGSIHFYSAVDGFPLTSLPDFSEGLLDVL